MRCDCREEVKQIKLINGHDPPNAGADVLVAFAAGWPSYQESGLRQLATGFHSKQGTELVLRDLLPGPHIH
jgi:hypothetical protein